MPTRAGIKDVPLVSTTTPEAMAGYVARKAPLEEMQASGAITIEGDRNAHWSSRPSSSSREGAEPPANADD